MKSFSSDVVSTLVTTLSTTRLYFVSLFLQVTANWVTWPPRKSPTLDGKEDAIKAMEKLSNRVSGVEI